uniref:RNA helicase n=1 Tax=Panagrolaimus sp. PS1159 TaxID=55785 RepID=A0AC35G834_9BILA
MSDSSEDEYDAEAAEQIEETEEIKTFAELGVNEVLCEACERLGWKIPSKIQASTLPAAFAGKDVIGLAETGSEETKGFNLRSLKFLVMDEADRMLNLDFEVELDKILKVIPKDRRTFLFSATMTKKVAKLERASLKDPMRIEVSNKYKTVKSLMQFLLFVPQKYKEANLVYVLNEKAGNTFIIFCSTCQSVMKTTLMLRHLGFPALPLHGQMSQTKRLGSLNKFKAKERSILVCTDVASRGLDIPHVDVVINYDVPAASKDYIHRVGRTARAGRKGVAITVVTQYDVELYQKVENLIGVKLEKYPTNNEEVLLLVESVTNALRLASNEIKELDKDKKSGKKRNGNSAFLDDIDADEGNSKFLKKRKGKGDGGRGGKMKVRRKV